MTTTDDIEGVHRKFAANLLEPLIVRFGLILANNRTEILRICCFITLRIYNHTH